MEQNCKCLSSVIVLSTRLGSDSGEAGKGTLHCQNLCLPRIEIVACLTKIGHCEVAGARRPALEHPAAAEAREVRVRGR